MARGSIEDARYRRLHDLKAGMDQLQGLDSPTKKDILKLLKESPLSTVDDSSAILVQTARETADIEPSKFEIPVVEPSDIIKPQPVVSLSVCAIFWWLDCGSHNRAHRYLTRNWQPTP